ncbi:MAG: hypothetical protein N4A46_12945 [Schleiferiaceae bacterium]|jgi:hypothetical protein|nr:hypothetical protein [Schleiferiaceae bacterium]
MSNSKPEWSSYFRSRKSDLFLDVDTNKPILSKNTNNWKFIKHGSIHKVEPYSFEAIYHERLSKFLAIDKNDVVLIDSPFLWIISDFGGPTGYPEYNNPMNVEIFYSEKIDLTERRYLIEGLKNSLSLTTNNPNDKQWVILTA